MSLKAIRFKLIIKVKDDNDNIKYKDIYCNLKDLLESQFDINDWSEEEGYQILEINACHLSNLKDDDDKEIWENDIIEYHTIKLNEKTGRYDIPIVEKLIVKYKEGSFYAGNIALNFYARNHCKIIGNKYHSLKLMGNIK